MNRTSIATLMTCQDAVTVRPERVTYVVRCPEYEAEDACPVDGRHAPKDARAAAEWWVDDTLLTDPGSFPLLLDVESSNGDVTHWRAYLTRYEHTMGVSTFVDVEEVSP